MTFNKSTRTEKALKIFFLIIILITGASATNFNLGSGTITATTLIQNGYEVCDTSNNCGYATTETTAITICGDGEYLNGEGTCDTAATIISQGGGLLTETGDVGGIASSTGTDITEGTPCTSGTCTLTIDVTDVLGTGLTESSNNIVISTTYQGANARCSGTTTYLDGTGTCDDISNVYIDGLGDTMTLSSDLNLDSNGFVIDVSGSRIGLGTSTPETAVQIDADSPNVSFSYFGTAGTADTSLGAIYFGEGTGERQAIIEAVRDAASTSGTDLPSRIALWTTPDGSNTPVERMRITKDGDVFLGVTSGSNEFVVNGDINLDGFDDADGTVSIDEISITGTDIIQPSTLRIYPNGETDDMLVIYTSSNNPYLATSGSGDLYFKPLASQVYIGTSTSANDDLLIDDGGLCLSSTSAIACSTPTDGDLEVEDGSICIGINDCSAGTSDGYVYVQGGVSVGYSTIQVPKPGYLRVGSTTQDGSIEVQDGSVCIGTAGCTSYADGGLLLENTLTTRLGTSSSGTAYTKFGSGSPGHVSASTDVYVGSQLEIDGYTWLDGGTGDVAETIHTKESVNKDFCKGEISCLKESTNDNLDYGDIVCIDIYNPGAITKCEEKESNLVVGVISNTTRLSVGETYGYPIAIAGVVYTKVTNQAGSIYPGDLLITSNIDGYGMKSKKEYPEPLTVFGKAFGKCEEKECVIPVLVSLR